MLELYKKYRPKTLDRMVGCEATAASLAAMLAKGTLPHAILFSGPSGTGKTSLARILRTELKCSDLDFCEMNSASYRGIDSIRDIQRVMMLAPAAGPCRIWLLDEAHQISRDGQVAMLKMLEDTPDHCYFFLATTDPMRLIETIRNRCTEMKVKSLSYKELLGLCEKVAKKEGIELSNSTKDSLAASAMGSARKLLVLLEKVSHLDEAQRQAAIEEGVLEEAECKELCKALIDKRPWKQVCGILSNIKGDPEDTRRAVLGYARACLMGKNPQLRFYTIIRIFENNLYDSGAAGLAAACYEACSVKE